ncbi:hypothetical protein G647_06955, partial [Cladophialophora carrionii CBS 160.54]
MPQPSQPVLLKEETPADRALRRIQTRFKKETRDMTKGLFVGLCAVLYTLLRWGYQMKELEMERFIALYPTYERETRHQANAVPYHLWVRPRLPTIYKKPVLKEQNLREIWRDHHYHFLLVELGLENV